MSSAGGTEIAARTIKIFAVYGSQTLLQAVALDMIAGGAISLTGHASATQGVGNLETVARTMSMSAKQASFFSKDDV